MIACGAAHADDSAALAGPSVAPVKQQGEEGSEMQPRASIVRRNFQGEVELIEDQRIEVAAVRAMKLDDATRVKIDTLLAERSALTSRLTLENYELFIKLQGSFQAGEPSTQDARRERMTLVRELRTAVKQLLEPTLLDALAAQLNAAQAQELRGIVAEYRDATKDVRDRKLQQRRGNRDETMPDAKREADVESKQSDEASDDAGMQADRRDTLRERAHTRANENMQHAREETIEVLREMGRSFSGFVNERRERLETLLASINATPEQRAKIDAIIRKDGDAAALQPTDAQRASMLREIIGVLTPEQRKQFLQDRRELAK
jgi:hypothetical protein